jgi:hypothetical protein
MLILTKDGQLKEEILDGWKFLRCLQSGPKIPPTFMRGILGFSQSLSPVVFGLINQKNRTV